jgi:HK97 family phage portal protein
MSLWQRLLGRSNSVKVSAAGAVISAWNLGQAVWTDRRYDRIADEAYVRNAVAYRCTKLIASNAASVPWLLYKGKGKRKTEIEEHKLLALLSRPAPMTGGATLFEAFYAYLLLAGNSYLEAVGPDNSPPRELWTLRPDRMRVVPGDFGIPGAFEYEAHGRKMRWDVDPTTGAGEILHLKEFHPINDWYGLSRVDPGAYAVDRHNAASAHNKALLDNGARPSGALIFQPVAGATGEPAQSAPREVLQEAEERLLKRYGGPENAGRPMVLGGNVKWEDMAFSPKDMDFGKSKDDAARDICTAFGVPHILVVPGSATYNNIREAKLELWEDTILPLVDRAKDSLNAWLAPKFGEGLSLSGDLDEIPALEPRREAKRKSITELLDKGVIDADEARDALQYGPRAAGAVKKADASVVSALVATIAQVGLIPLIRYLKSCGLLDEGMTEQQALAMATALIADQTDDELAAATPGKPANNDDAPEEDETDDAAA